MPNPAAIERAVLAAVAGSDDWPTAKMIAARLSLPESIIHDTLAALCQAGDMDWLGVDVPDSWTANGPLDRNYHLPLREVRVGRRLECAS